MTHNDVLEYFKLLFPLTFEQVVIWFPNGRNSIRVRILNNQEFVFTYTSQREWKFETLDEYMKGMRK